MNFKFPGNSSIGASGEHIVLSHLLKLNYIAGLAPYNTKEYVIFPVNCLLYQGFAHNMDYVSLKIWIKID